MSMFSRWIVLYAALALLIGYCLGCVNMAYILGRIHHIDIREHGSGNAGSTNTLRTLGPKVAAVNLVGDVLKGLVAVWIGSMLIGGDSGAYPELQHQLLGFLAGFGAVLGHNFPFYLGFHGGKGIATTGAVCLWYSLPMSGVILAIFILVVAVSGYVSLGSVVGLILIPVGVAVMPYIVPESAAGYFYHPVEGAHWILVLAALCFTVLGIYRHRENLSRLAKGTENKISFHKQEDA